MVNLKLLDDWEFRYNHANWHEERALMATAIHKPCNYGITAQNFYGEGDWFIQSIIDHDRNCNESES